MGSVRDAEIVERVLAGETLQQVAHDHGLTRQRVSQIVKAAAPCFDGDLRRSRRAEKRRTACRETRGRPRQWTAPAILDALRTGAIDGRAPALHRWAANASGPSPSMIVGRFGSWNAACAAAGLEVNPAPGSRMVPPTTVISAVAKYLASGGTGVRGYAVWSRINMAPSPGTVRARFGSWSAAKTVATAILANI